MHLPWPTVRTFKLGSPAWAGQVFPSFQMFQEFPNFCPFYKTQLFRPVFLWDQLRVRLNHVLISYPSYLSCRLLKYKLTSAKRLNPPQESTVTTLGDFKWGHFKFNWSLKPWFKSWTLSQIETTKTKSPNQKLKPWFNCLTTHLGYVQKRLFGSKKYTPLYLTKEDFSRCSKK